MFYRQAVNVYDARGVCQLRTLFFSFACLLALLPAGGCGGPASAPPSDRLPAQMTKELFEAVAARDHARTDKALRRIQDAFPSDPFPEMVRRQVYLRDGLVEINRNLAQGRLPAAQAALARLERELGVVPELLPVRETLAALDAVAAHRRGGPYRTSAEAEKALAAVVSRDAAFRDLPLNNSWREAQEAGLALLVQQEKRAAFRTRLLVYDTLAVAGKPEAETELAALRSTAEGLPGLPPAAVLFLASDPAPADLEPWLAAEKWGDAAVRPYLEVVFCREWPRLPEAMRSRLALLASDAATATVSGEVLKIRLNAQAGKTAQACALAGQLLRRRQISEALVAEGIARLFLPPDAMKTKAWTAPFPTLTDYLDHLEQLRRNAPVP
jgi:hypothetical protein